MDKRDKVNCCFHVWTEQCSSLLHSSTHNLLLICCRLLRCKALCCAHKDSHTSTYYKKPHKPDLCLVTEYANTRASLTLHSQRFVWIIGEYFPSCRFLAKLKVFCVAKTCIKARPAAATWTIWSEPDSWQDLEDFPLVCYWDWMGRLTTKMECRGGVRKSYLPCVISRFARAITKSHLNANKLDG